MSVIRTAAGKIIELGGHASQIEAAAAAPTFTLVADYQPSRDGVLNLLTPRYQPRGTDPKGGSDIYSGNYEYDADPRYAWTNGYTPFSVDQAGVLHIKAQRTSTITPAFAAGEVPIDPASGQPFQYMSGLLTTKTSLTQTGGRWEVEAKMPGGKGAWPAIWLMPVDEAHPPETDLIEMVGGIDPPTTYRTNAIALSGQNSTSVTAPGAIDLTADFHVYGVETDFAAQTISFLLDGNVVNVVAIANLPEFMRPVYLLFGMQVGSRLGGWVPAPDNTTPDVLDMQVRSVKMSQRAGPVSIDLSAAAYPDTVPVGGQVATISTAGYGGSTGHVVTIAADPDGAFAVDGLTLRRTAATGSSHQVRLLVTDSAGRTLQRLFTLTVIASLPAAGNLLASTDLTSAAWVKEGVTAPAPDTLREQAGSGGHDVLVAAPVAKPGTAGRYLFSVDATPQGTPWLEAQIFASSGNTTSYGISAIAWWDVVGGKVGYVTSTGGWSNVVATVTPLGAGVLRLQVSFTAASETGLVPLLRLATGQDGSSYAGDPTKGMKLDGLWLGVATG